MKEEKIDIRKREEMSGMEMWLPEEKGEEITGKVVKIEDGLYGKSYTLLDEETMGEIKLPSHRWLLARLVKIEEGDTIEITYLGEKPATKKGYNPVKMYQVVRLT